MLIFIVPNLLTMSDYDWSCFKRSLFLNVDPDTVLSAWITPSKLATWFLLKADYLDDKGDHRDPDQHIEVGDTYEWQWWNYEGIEKGKILDLDFKKRHLEFSFASEQCTVIVDIEVRKGDTLLRLEQINIPTDEENKIDLHLGCCQGWSFWMVNLKSWLEHGVILHDREVFHRTKDFGFAELINR